ncbi:MAG: L-aspartate oxidase [Cyanobacteria bacterium HKST-UBA04]|nr:L-aspartate oxidase [Cyanobacteria bacterium HKST-UBA04]
MLIIGSGIAGLLTALKLAQLGVACTVVTKSQLHHNSSWLAQGGIAAVLPQNPVDSIDDHVKDTLFAGAGLSDEAVVRSIVSEGAEAIADLIALGVPFDVQADGSLAFTREAAHTQHRILHAGGDATGKSIQQTLIEAVTAHEKIDVLEHTMVAKLLVRDGTCYGAIVVGPGQRHPKPRMVLASHTVLATGGLGQLYEHTTNPPIATADGIALACQAGATIQDIEFVQFHPTAFWADGRVHFLISEALRGEGGVLLNKAGQRFVLAHHASGELAPRDVVTRAIAQQIEADGLPYVHLDISHLPAAQIETRFPNILANCQRFGIDIRRHPIPVAPAAHYAMGGVKVDDRGKSEVANLLAVGEVVSSGLHGANRLASNSLLECVVLARRVALDIASGQLPPSQSTYGDWTQYLSLMASFETSTHATGLGWAIHAFGSLMWHHAGICREAAQLRFALKALDDLWQLATDNGWFAMVPDGLAFRNMLIGGQLIVQAALQRTESVGAHYRTDFPAKHTRPTHSQLRLSDLTYHQELAVLNKAQRQAQRGYQHQLIDQRTRKLASLPIQTA